MVVWGGKCLLLQYEVKAGSKLLLSAHQNKLNSKRIIDGINITWNFVIIIFLALFLDFW